MAQPSVAPELVLETETGTTVMIPGRDYHVGRDPSCEIVIDDDRVSWHHAVLKPEDGHWTLEDEDSTNGTYADGRRIHEWDVGPGSVIRFGNPAKRGSPAPASVNSISRMPTSGGRCGPHVPPSASANN